MINLNTCKFKLNNNEFTIEKYKKSSEKDSFENTLLKIEKIIQNKMKYISNDKSDPLNNLPLEIIYQNLFYAAQDLLKSETKSNATKKSSLLSLSINKPKESPQTIFNRIYCLQTQPRDFIAHYNVDPLIFQYLNLSTLNKVAKINKSCKEHSDILKIKKAQEYGYKGGDSKEANNYLKELFSSLLFLIKDDQDRKSDDKNKINFPIIYRDKNKKIVDIELSLKNFIYLIKLAKENKDIQTSDSKSPLFLKQINFALHLEISEGRKDLVYALMIIGAEYNNTPIYLNKDNPQDLSLKKAQTPLTHSIYKTRPKKNTDDQKKFNEIVILLIENGADITLPNEGQQSPLGYAALYNNFNLVNYFSTHSDISKTINYQNELGNTALHIAVILDHMDIVKKLIEMGADQNLLNKKMKTPYQEALTRGNPAVIKLLESNMLEESKNFKDVIVSNKTTELMYIAESGNPELIKEFLNSSIQTPIDQKNSDGLTALHFAAMSGSLATFQLLLDAGANILEITNNHNNVAGIAAQYGSVDILNFLIKNNFDVNQVNARGRTPLHIAAFSLQIEACQILGREEIFNRQDYRGNTPFHLALLKANGNNKDHRKKIANLYHFFKSKMNLSIGNNQPGNKSCKDLLRNKFGYSFS